MIDQNLSTNPTAAAHAKRESETGILCQIQSNFPSDAALFEGKEVRHFLG